MVTNQTEIITAVQTEGGINVVNTAVNTFITNGIASGYINFDIKPVFVVIASNASGATTQFCYTVQINYYNPAIM